MQSIGLAKPQHAKAVAEFQVTMAKETQNVELNLELVEKGIQYFLSLSSVDKSSQLGFYLLKFEGKKPIGSLLITYESGNKWWIQSVFILEEYRRHGHFTSLFKRAVELARENGIQSIKLYAQHNNEQAKATYFKLGMHVIEGLFYAYDFVLGNPQISINNHFQFVQDANNNQSLSKWKQQNNNILGIQLKQTSGNFVTIEKDKTVIGVFKFFEEFSDWRFGITRYVQEIYLNGYSLSDVAPSIIDYLVKSSKIKVAVVRFILISEAIAASLIGGHLEQYEILAIELK